MRKIVALILSLVVAISLTACVEQTKSAAHLELDSWNDNVKQSVNDLVDKYGKSSSDYAKDTYAVFDFDNTCSIFDVEEQIAVYQLQVMAFAFDPEELPEILKTDIGMTDATQDLSTQRACYSKDGVEHSYQDWIDDISAAYAVLYDNYGPFTTAGLDEAAQEKIQSDPQWLEFAAKMRAMYDCVFESESSNVAYPWILYWFTGMTEDEVYALAAASHSKYKELETSEETWTSPESVKSKLGVVEYTWTSGTQVSDNIREMWKVLDENGIDVWVCSASGTDPIRAAIDVWGLHPYCTGMIAMTNKLADGKYINAYDYETGCGWYAKDDGKWEKMTAPVKSQTQGVGKVTAIVNAISPEYNNHGPIAGFMDSTGDYNFCTEFKTLKLVIVFNRASRKVTDGGGVIAELAVYQRNTLSYDFAKADAAGDTLYVLQGRDENGLRTFRNSDKTLCYGNDTELLFKNEDNEAQLEYMIDNAMSTEEIINTFAIKTAADAEDNKLGIKYGFLTKYAGYHTHE